MNHQIPYSSYRGNAEQLCAKGNAVEFIQPWYSPISTTPENTGIAIGGIGSTFTLTPLGHTPNFSFIPGIYIDNSDSDINFNDFYVSVADPLDIDVLQILNQEKLEQYLHFYPATFDGDLLTVVSSGERLNKIKSALTSGKFYSDNRGNFERWNIEFSPKTTLAIKTDAESLESQLLVALDFFNGLLINNTSEALSLTANSQQKDIDTIDAAVIGYKALYPMAEYDYRGFDEIKIKRKVTSPMVKGDKKLCSLPVHWNEFELCNHSAQPKSITLVQSLKSLLGSTYRKGRPGVQDSACFLVQNPIRQKNSALSLVGHDQQFTGVLLESDSPYQSDIDGEALFGVDCSESSKALSVSIKPSIYVHNEQNEINNALNTGRVNTHFDKGIYSGREALSSIVTVQIDLEPGAKETIRFVQVMDHSKISLQDWQSEKAYSRYYRDCEYSRAQAILQDVLPEINTIEEKIVQQQTLFLNHAKKANSESSIKDPDMSSCRFATMAMNTLSFLAESSVWDTEDKLLVKECVDYPFFNSLDVYFYGSYSLLYLLPELDGCVMQAFAQAIQAEDHTKRRFWEYEDKPNAELVDAKYEGTRAIRGAVIHDLGSPFDIQPDAYSWHNVKEWKDLAPKYILMVYRHFMLTKNKQVIEACWPAIKESIDYLCALIADGDALPLTRGTDDTFDNLSSHGISIYCGSLWAAGLRAASELAVIMNEETLAAQYQQQSANALEVLQRGLWDEEQGYFHFYITPIQTKHLTGWGYQPLLSLGLHLTGDKIADKETLNRYIDSAEPSRSMSKLDARKSAKQRLADIAPEAFTDEYQSILVLDSDNSFGDALLADSYLKLLGLEGLFSGQQVERALDYVYQTNYKRNSPTLGVANMTLADGMPHDAFQAQDVWIGVQYSVATAMRLAGKSSQATELMDTLYHALYHQAKIPFAAPEGFNCSVVVTAEGIAGQFNLSNEQAEFCFQQLLEKNCLLPDGRVNPYLTNRLEAFSELIVCVVEPSIIEPLHVWLQHTGLKYTAGRYFRPGMIFAYLPEAL